MAKPMYSFKGRGLDLWYKTWQFRLFGQRRVLVFRSRWIWFDQVWRFNGGGYAGWSDGPYHETTIGCFTFRTYGFPPQKK